MQVVRIGRKIKIKIKIKIKKNRARSAPRKGWPLLLYLSLFPERGDCPPCPASILVLIFSPGPLTSTDQRIRLLLILEILGLISNRFLSSRWFYVRTAKHRLLTNGYHQCRYVCTYPHLPTGASRSPLRSPLHWTCFQPLELR